MSNRPDNLSSSQRHSKFAETQHLKAADAAKNTLEFITKDSNLSHRCKLDELPRFDRDEVHKGDLLGKGGYSDVYEIISFGTLRQSAQMCIRKSSIDSDGTPSEISTSNARTFDFSSASKRVSIVNEEVPIDEDEFEDKKFIAKHCRREQSGDARYAIKHLRSDVIKSSAYFQGAADLVIEAYLLSSICHPNIIKIRGISGAGIDGFANPEELGYFIVMDRLYDTLETRIKKWSEINKKNHRLRNKIIQKKSSRKKKLNMFLADRLKAMFDIAGALLYLHSNGIIYRDLKPENIGFDIRGDAKLFDFGLSTEALERDRNGDGTYNLSIDTGTRRYMAPEVAKGAPYNHFVDVYSFGLILYEVCHLCTIFKTYSYSMHEKMVIQEGFRPEIHRSLSPPIQSLISRTWDGCWSSRPDFQIILQRLKLEVMSLRGGDHTGLEHKRRRSTFVRIANRSLQKVRRLSRSLSLSDMGEKAIGNDNTTESSRLSMY